MQFLFNNAQKLSCCLFLKLQIYIYNLSDTKFAAIELQSELF